MSAHGRALINPGPAGRPGDADDKLAEGLRVFAILRADLPPAKAAKLAAAISGAPRKLLYGGAE